MAELSCQTIMARATQAYVAIMEDTCRELVPELQHVHEEARALALQLFQTTRKVGGAHITDKYRQLLEQVINQTLFQLYFTMSVN